MSVETLSDSVRARPAARVALSPAPAGNVMPWYFTAVEASPPPASAYADPGLLLDPLAAVFARLTGFEWAVALGRSDEAWGDAAATGFVRGDGTTVGLALPDTLAAALVAARCGGGFDPAGTHPAAPSVARVRGEIEAAMLCAVDRAWPGAGDWTPGPPASEAFVVAATGGGHSFAIVVAVALPAPAAADPAHADPGWSDRLRAALDATPFALRAVLHERSLRLDAAVALRVGDVITLDTRRDVALRLGDRAIARGTIASEPDGGHRVTVVGLAAAGLVLPLKEPAA